MSQHMAVQPRDAVPFNTHNLTLAHHRVSSSPVVERPIRSRRVVGSNPIWDSDFFRVYVFPRIYIISCCCYFSVSILTQEVGWTHLDMPKCDGVMPLVSSYVMPLCDSVMLLKWVHISQAHGCVAARCGSSQYPQFDSCSPQSLQQLSGRASDQITASRGFKSLLGHGFFLGFSQNLRNIMLLLFLCQYTHSGGWLDPSRYALL